MNMENIVPDIIKKVGFDFEWDVQKVWKLDILATEMDIEELTWHFDIPFHDHQGKPYTLTSREIIENPEKYKEEYERTIKADLQYPIDIMENNLDAYYLGIDTPVDHGKGKCIAIAHRKNDDDDKLIVAPEGFSPSDKDIQDLIHFQEQFFDSEILRP